nr:DinB family protein [Allomuricauda sp.]
MKNLNPTRFFTTVVLLLLLGITMNAQEDQVPYYEIPDYPADYGPGNVAARMIDGLGFRFHWASKDLRQEDLDYKPSEDSRTVMETLHHIYAMSGMIKNAPLGKANELPEDYKNWPYEKLRRKTLENLQKASQLMAGKQAEDFENFRIVFQGREDQKGFPYWNMINGMLSDCIYHTGQITMLRRASGNPIAPNLSMFNGRLRTK